MKVNLDVLLSPNKILPIYLQRKNMDNDRLCPNSVELHWTSNCNYNCIHCSYGIRRKNKSQLSLKTIESLVQSLIDLKTQNVYLSGGGEPTLIRDWVKYADKLLTEGVDVALISNGTNIKEIKLDVIRKMNYIAISIYSTDETEYKTITEGNYYDSQFNLPKKIKQIESRVIIGSRCVINSINYKNIVSIYKKAMEVGYDYIIFIPVVDYEGECLDLNEKQMIWLHKTLKENYSIFDLNKTNINKLLSKKISHYSKNDYRIIFYKSPKKCSNIDIRGTAFVNYDGGVYLCQPHIGKKDYSIGNLNDTNFTTIWNSKKHFEVIEKLHEEFKQGKCKNCRAIAFNQCIDKYENSGSMTFEVVKDSFI